MKILLFRKTRWSSLLSTLLLLGLALVLLRWGPSLEFCWGGQATGYPGDAAKYNPPPPEALRPLDPAFQPLDSNRPLKQPNILTNPQRTDVVLATPWLAPIVWDMTFDTALLDAIYQPRNITVATTVFAYGKYTRFLKDFLETAERHFFVGYNVRYYVFTDQPNAVPSVEMGAGREMLIRSVQGMDRWQDITAGRMKQIQALIETGLRGKTDYIFCFDVDMKFHAHFGAETLGQLIAGLHPDFYYRERSEFTYERRNASKAYMAPHQGDYYYQANIFGGELVYVHHLVSTCNHNIELDTQQGIEAVWQDESHFNRYLWLHKPTKVLSPEYLWIDALPVSNYPVVKIKRLASVIKEYGEVRPN